jgi:hypothetical protein
MNNSLIVLYKGRRGCGKTLTMVKDGYAFFLNGFRVLRNFNCQFGEYISEEEILKLDKNSDVEDCVIMIDEIQIFFDSRRSMNKKSIDFSNFIQQIRKRNINLLCATQYSNTIDIRLRQHTDIIVYPNFIKDLNVCEVVYLDITTLQDDFFNSTEPKQVKIVYNASEVYPLFNTKEMIK